MKSSTFYFKNEDTGIQHERDAIKNPDIVFYFFDSKLAEHVDLFSVMTQEFPNAILFGCSTSGPALEDDVYVNMMTGIALSFEKTKLKTFQMPCDNSEHSFEVGKQLVESLIDDDLRHIFTIADGINVNGTELMRGASSVLPEKVRISGGLSSDNFEFKETMTGINSSPDFSQVCAIGFYGDSLQVGCGADGGWNCIGTKRIVTKSVGNMLYELDGQSALTLYKHYLGDDAKGLPSSGLLFPLSIRGNSENDLIVRTITGIDEDKDALQFAGDVPQGATVQFMKGNFDRLIDGAGNAAQKACADINGQSDKSGDTVALIVSCLGRQLLMGQQISGELEAVKDVLGEEVPMCGFYSNGEFSLRGDDDISVLHNQTMTLTLLREV